MTGPVPIRRAGAADAAILSGLGTATFVEAFGHLYHPADLADYLASAHSPACYARTLAEPGVAVWLAVAGENAPLGYAVAGPCKLPVPDLEPGAGELRRLYVRAPAHGRGLGTRLVVTALEWLTAQPHAPLYVGVWSRNFGAQRLYERFGFTKVGEYEFPVGRQRDLEFIMRRTGAC